MKRNGMNTPADDLVPFERNCVADLPLGLLEDVVDVVDAGDAVVVDLDLLGEILEQRIEALGLEAPGDDVFADVDGPHPRFVFGLAVA